MGTLSCHTAANIVDQWGTTMTKLTPRQIQILRWIDENPVTRARWLVNNREPSNSEPPHKWNVFEMSGRNGSIRVKMEDHVALHVFKTFSPSPETMFGITDEARAIIAQHR